MSARSGEDVTATEGGGMTIAQFAARCRERCTTPAQGTNGPCGEADENDDGETVFHFCGRHWGPVLDAMEADDGW